MPFFVKFILCFRSNLRLYFFYPLRFGVFTFNLPFTDNIVIFVNAFFNAWG